MVTAEDTELISIADAVRRFGVSRVTLRDWMERGLITRHEREIGKTRVFVDAREIERKLQPRPKELP